MQVTPTIAALLWGCDSCPRGSGRYSQEPVQEVIKAEDPPPATATHADEVVQVHLALCGQEGELDVTWSKMQKVKGHTRGQLTFGVDWGIVGRWHLPGTVGIPHVGAIGRKAGQEAVSWHRSQLPVRAGSTVTAAFTPNEANKVFVVCRWLKCYRWVFKKN